MVNMPGPVAVAVAAVCVVAALCVSPAYGLSCQADNGGGSIDWWIALKTPIESHSSNPNVQGGVAYAYIDAEDGASSFTLTSESLASSKGSSLWETLDGVYNGGDGIGYLMFNDETPAGKSAGTKAHQKGVIAFDESGGFWLIHSVPRFPNTVADGYDGFPDNEDKYGQSFMCISFDYDDIDTLGDILYVSRPNIYDSNIPDSFQGLDTLRSVVSGSYNKTAAADVVPLVSAAGTKFTAFTKNRQWDSDLYEYLVAPHFGSGMMAETWMNGVNPLPTYCSPDYAYDLQNIRVVTVHDTKGDNVSWKETQDHSKWAVTTDMDVACVGGINRQNGQRVRGGGTVCIQSRSIWSAFNATIVDVDPCSS